MRLLAVIHALALGVTQAKSQTTFARIDSLFESMRSGEAAPAVGIAIVLRDSVIYSNVTGFADLERGTRANMRTRFDWASIAKQVTAYGVSLLVEQGRLATTDDVRNHIPELDLAGARLNISDLLHHTSGLEDGDGLYALSGGRQGDPVAHEDMLRVLLRQQHLRFAPGSSHFYSNGGYTLLVEIVQRLTKKPFAAWCDSAIFQPLGMHRSGFVDAPSKLIPERALPYARDRGRGYRLSTSDLYPGAGGLFASVNDMAQWMRHVLRAEQRPMARLRQRGRLRDGDSLQYAWGLGWGSYRGLQTLGHAGSGPATAAQLLMIPDLQFGVVVAVSGIVDANPTTVAFLAADLTLGDRLAPRDTAAAGGRRMMMITEEQMRERPHESNGVHVTASVLQRYAGRYRMPDGETMVIRARGDSLEWAINGRLPYIPLFPLPNGKFVAVPWWDTFHFEMESNGSVSRIIREATVKSLRGAHRTPAVGVRLPEQRFTSQSAAPYVGLYVSDELQTLYRVDLSGDRLVLVHARHGVLPLIPLDERHFAVNGGGIAGAHFAMQGDRMIGLELEAVSWGAKTTLRRIE